MAPAVLPRAVPLRRPDVTLTRSRGCGSRGGPGYRGPDGRCVGWKRLKRVCGEPPETLCTREAPAEGPRSKAPDGPDRPALGLMGIPSPPSQQQQSEFAHRATRADGVACRSPIALRQHWTCRRTAPLATCDAALAEAVAAGSCLKLPKGSEALIEAGDGGFELVRVRVKGLVFPVWLDRALVVDDAGRR